jgi:RecT family protein
MSNELAVITPNEWQAMTEQAAALVSSGFLPQSVNTPQKAIAIMMLGRELGIGAWAALTTVNVIQGKPSVSPQLMLALINRSGQLEDMKIQDEGGTVHVMMKRKGRTEHWECFGQADAEKMGLWSKPNWKAQPATMMKWRAVAACARVVFADVILGLYTPEEMGADVTTDEQGNMTVIEVKPTPQPQLVDKVADVETGEIVEQKPSMPTTTPPGKQDVPAYKRGHGRTEPTAYQPEQVTEANPLMDEEPSQPVTTSDAAFDDIALATRTPEQPSLELVDRTEHPKHKRVWDIGKVAYHTKFKAKHIDVEKEGEAGADKHFENLIKSLEVSMQITDTSTTEEVIAVVDAHYTAKKTKERKSA